MTNQPPTIDFAAVLDAVTLARPRALTKEQIEAELARCAADVIYFTEHYVKIYDSVTKSWIPFRLWTAQKETIRLWQENKFLVVMKARQMGFTWLLGDALVLWQMIFQPIAHILIFSQREKEAKELLGRITGSYKLLPDWMRLGVTTENTEDFAISNSSSVQALPGTAGGRSNAATYVVVDEADFVENLGRLISNAKPTIDAGDNKMAVLSTVNDEIQGSHFQNLYTSSRDGNSQWKAVFFGWNIRPDRTQEWYEREKQDSFNQHGSYDRFFKQYPTTDTEALSARSLNTRFPPLWLSAVSRVQAPLPAPAAAPVIPGLKIYLTPKQGHRYGLGADPAGGMMDSDDSALCVLDRDTLEQVAALQNKVEPTEFANQATNISVYYLNAPVLFELNNHGHAFLSQCRERGTNLRMGLNRRGRTERDPGWITSERSKGTLYDAGGEAMRQVLVETLDAEQKYHPEQARKILLDQKTINQIGMIDINTLEAPENAHDDAAMAWVLACKCIDLGMGSMFQVPHTGLWNSRERVIDAVARPVAALPATALKREETVDEMMIRLRTRGMKR